MNRFKDSNGNKHTKPAIDRYIREAKKRKIDMMYDEYGYVFCEDCGRSNGVLFDCSHDVSVDRAQKEGRCELAWDVDNISIRCRDCHRKHDKLN